MHRLCVHTRAKFFSALPLPRVTLPIWVPHNSNWKFNPLSWPKGKQLCNSSGGGQMTLPNCDSECNSAHPHLPATSPWEAGNPREKLSTWKRITRLQLAQSKVIGMSLFISSWAAVRLHLRPARHDHSGHGPVKHKDMASLRLLKCFKVTAW